jgi:hypothetical protein
MDRQTDRANQRNRLLDLLKNQSPYWVPISDVVSIAGFQYGARIFELRRLGHRIENDPGRAFRLVTRPISEATTPTPAATERAEESPANRESLFGELSPDRSYRE